MIKKPAIFLDRDNTLNVDVEYTYKLADFRWVPGAPEALRLFTMVALGRVSLVRQGSSREPLRPSR